MSLPVYSSKSVVTNFLGFTLEGLAPDSFIEFSLNSDLTDTEVGADGSVSISISPDDTGTATISLQPNSRTNWFLSGVLNKQRAEKRLARGAFTIKDPSGSVLAVLKGAHIKTAPTTSLGTTMSGKTLDWTIFVEEIQFLSLPEGLVDDAGILAEVTAALDNLEGFFG